jgi:aminopeptidase N
VAVRASYDAQARTYRLDVTQTLAPTPGQPTKDPMVVPLSVGLLDAGGGDLPLTLADGRPLERGLLTLTRPSESFVFRDVATAPVASINRGFSAPINLVFDQSDAELRFLAANDSDPFNRWQALQRLATLTLLGNVATPGSRDYAGLIDAFGLILDDSSLEPAFAALALSLPSEADLARDLGRNVDPDAIFDARRALRVAISKALAAPLNETYQRMTSALPYSPDATSAGRRSLRNVSLDLLAAAGEPAAIALAAHQYSAADNMTDRLAALATLCLHRVPERRQALDDFYQRFENDALVIDKWFALQAAVPEPDTLARVRELTTHKAFSIGNPNRVRSLIGAFAQTNPTQFNRPDGSGYEFVAETVLALDAKNPQVAARLMTAYRAWRTLEPIRRARAEHALRRVAQAQGLSRDLADIVERSLAPT